MKRYCLLDLLPVELLHTLFTYFLAHEILLTFSDVSDYIDAVLISYTSYRLNFRSIRKFDFDLVCRRIRPEQVISLIVSDDNDTPGQSELFLSCFRIEELIQLRSLTLIQPEIDSLKLICPNLYKLRQLRWFSFDIETIRHKYPISNNESNRFKSLLLETYTRVLPQLTHIDLNHSADLVSISLPNLRYLKLSKFSIDHLEIIFQNALQLKSLDISLHMNTLDSEFILPTNQLIQLNLKIENRRISKDEIERFLSNLPHLKHLKLDTPVWPDVADGHFLQVLTNSLLTFHFKFTALQIDIPRILDSFRTSFWLEEKHWFVGYLDYSLFSIPYFAPVHMDSCNLPHFHSTIPDHSFIYKHLNKITMNTSLLRMPDRLTQIKILVLECPISLKILESSIDLNQVKHLIVSSLDHLLTLMPLMPQLEKLTVKNHITIEMIERIRSYRLEQIRTLEIRITNEYLDCIIEELFRLFPRVERLIYKSTIESVGLMIRLINGFKYLSNASFCADCSFVRKELNFCRNPNSISQYNTCRVYHSTNTQIPFSIHWRIEKQILIQPSIHSLISKWPWRRGYYWYRLKHLLLRILYKHLLSIQYLIQFLIYLPITIVILRPYSKNFDSYFICFCLINTLCLTIFYNIFYRMSTFVKDDSIYIIFACRIYVWFVYCLIVFLFSVIFSNNL